MTEHDFVKMAERVYGKRYEINMEVQAIVRLLKTVPEEIRERYFDAVLSAHPKNWGLPDVAVLKKVWDDKCQSWYEVKAEMAWRIMLGKSPMQDQLIVDPIAYFVVSGYGTWEAFCDARDGQYRELEHKDFVKRYVQASKSKIDAVPVPLAGHIRAEYGSNAVGIEVNIIGDREKGLELLNNSKPSSLPDAVHKMIEGMRLKDEGFNG